MLFPSERANCILRLCSFGCYRTLLIPTWIYASIHLLRDGTFEKLMQSESVHCYLMSWLWMIEWFAAVAHGVAFFCVCKDLPNAGSLLDVLVWNGSTFCSCCAKAKQWIAYRSTGVQGSIFKVAFWGQWTLLVFTLMHVSLYGLTVTFSAYSQHLTL